LIQITVPVPEANLTIDGTIEVPGRVADGKLIFEYTLPKAVVAKEITPAGVQRIIVHFPDYTLIVE
jgi:hypothetical protein